MTTSANQIIHNTLIDRGRNIHDINMVSGTQILNMSHDNTKGSQHHHRSVAMKANNRKLRLLPISCTALLVLVVVVANSARASASSRQVKTIQQLRSLGQSGEQFRSKELDEGSLLMAKTAAMRAVTETYGPTRLQVVAPTNATTTAQETPESAGSLWASRIKRLVQSQGFQRMVMGNFMNTTTKVWRPTGNDLWDGILADCMQKPTFSCMQKNMYSYLDRTLLSSDVNVTDNFLFIKNQVNYTDELIRTNEIDNQEEELEFKPMTLNDPDSHHGRSRSYQSSKGEEDDTMQAGKLSSCLTIESRALELRAEIVKEENEEEPVF